jgi:hypothetical protein
VVLQGPPCVPPQPSPVPSIPTPLPWPLGSRP